MSSDPVPPEDQVWFLAPTFAEQDRNLVEMEKKKGHTFLPSLNLYSISLPSL